MPASEVLGWEIVERIEPFGEFGAYLRAGIIASTIANVQPSKRRRKMFKPSDFMPKFDADESADRGMDSRRIKGLMLAMQQAQKEKMARAKAKQEARERRKKQKNG
jgi:hypothetical protein